MKDKFKKTIIEYMTSCDMKIDSRSEFMIDEFYNAVFRKPSVNVAHDLLSEVRAITPEHVDQIAVELSGIRAGSPSIFKDGMYSGIKSGIIYVLKRLGSEHFA